MSFRTRIALALTVLATALTLLTASIIGNQLERSLRESVAAQQLALASRAAQEVDNILDASRRALVNVAHNLPRPALESTTQLQRWLEERPVLHTMFDDVLVLGKDGTLLGDYPILPGRRGSDFSDRDWFGQTLQSGKPMYSEPRTGVHIKAPVIIITAPLIDAHGKTQGMLAGIVRLLKPNFLGSIGSQKVGKSGYFLLASPSRKIIVHPESSRILENLEAPGAREALARAMSGDTGTLEGLDTPGNEALFTYRRLASTGWVMISVLPLSEAYAPVREVKTLLWAGALVLLVLSVGLIWLSLGALLAPIARLRKSMTQAKRRGFAAAEDVPVKGRDELAALAASYNEMAAIIRSRDHDLQESERRMREITSVLGFGVYALDERGLLTFFNPAAEKLLGWKEADVLGRDAHTVFHYQHADGSDYPVEECPAHRVISHGETVKVDHDWLTCKDGTLLPVEIFATPLMRDGKIAGAVTAFQDITDRMWLQDHLRQQATHDQLTGLPNRMLFSDRVDQAIAIGRRAGTSFALLAVDLDGFKTVNDTLGHEAGDHLLQQVARRLEAQLRQTDTVARLGGDEFAIVLPGAGGEAAELIAQKLVDTLAEPFTLAQGEAHIGASIGISLFPEDGRELDPLLSAADSALYASKAAGKSCWHRAVSGASPSRIASAGQRPPFIKWRAEYDVGISLLDTQHRGLADNINALEQAAFEAADAATLRDLARQLIDATRQHFATEEALMEQFHTPDRSFHKASHQALLQAAVALTADLDETRSRATLLTLRDWLLQHITAEDRMLCTELRNGGYV